MKFTNTRREKEAILNGKDPYEQAKKNIVDWMGNKKGQRKKDSLTPFRWFVLRAKFRSKQCKRKNCGVTPEFLKQLFDSQNGICPITGWNLVLPDSTSKGWSNGPSPQNASLDRIDPSMGYIETNVRFVSLMANHARNSFDDNTLIDFCESVVKNKKERHTI